MRGASVLDEIGIAPQQLGCRQQLPTGIRKGDVVRLQDLVKLATTRARICEPRSEPGQPRINRLHTTGVLLAGDGLKPSSEGKRVAFDGPGRTVIDGPFAATSELVAGFWLWEVKDMDEAVAWVKRCPNPMPGPSEIEIRPLYEMADFQ